MANNLSRQAYKSLKTLSTINEGTHRISTPLCILWIRKRLVHVLHQEQGVQHHPFAKAAGESATAGPAVGPLVPLALQPLAFAGIGQGRLAEGRYSLCVERWEVVLEDLSRYCPRMNSR
uniref:Uncharacterized protein n=1 Tax=Knipowitschia caucasica TaxID=637954 RepID=A0AAV2L6R4_KNICA